MSARWRRLISCCRSTTEELILATERRARPRVDRRAPGARLAHRRRRQRLDGPHVLDSEGARGGARRRRRRSLRRAAHPGQGARHRAARQLADLARRRAGLHGRRSLDGHEAPAGADRPDRGGAGGHRLRHAAAPRLGDGAIVPPRVHLAHLRADPAAAGAAQRQRRAVRVQGDRARARAVAAPAGARHRLVLRFRNCCCWRRRTATVCPRCPCAGSRIATAASRSCTRRFEDLKGLWRLRIGGVPRVPQRGGGA